MIDRQDQIADYPRQPWRENYTKRLIFVPLAGSLVTFPIIARVTENGLTASAMICPVIYVVLVAVVLKFWTHKWKEVPMWSFARLGTNVLFYGMLVGIPLLLFGASFISTD